MALSRPAAMPGHDTNHELDVLKREIRACLVATASKNMVTIQELNNSFSKECGRPIPFKQFNARSLEEFLLSIGDTVSMVKNRNSNTYFCGPVATKDSGHIQKLVGGQKTTLKKRGSGQRMRTSQIPSLWMNSPYRPVERHVQRVVPLMHQVLSQRPRNPYEATGINRTPYSAPQPLFPSDQPYVRMTSTGLQRTVPNTDVIRAMHSNAVRLPRAAQAPPISTLVRPPPSVARQHQPKQETLKERVQYLANLKGLPALVEKLLKAGKKKDEFVAKIEFGDEAFSSYPSTTKSREDALNIAYTKAFDELKKKTDLDMSLPETRDPAEVTLRVLQLLNGRPRGIWASDVKSLWYQQLFSERLPQNWVQNLDRNVLIVESVNKDFILNVHKKRTPSPTDVPCSSVELASPDSDEKQNFLYESGVNGNSSIFSHIQLPESDEWVVFITIVKNSSLVEFQIETSKEDLYNDLFINMELQYINDTTVLESVVIGQAYAVTVESSWFRAIVSQQNEDGTYVVELVDLGDVENVSLDKLRKLSPDFFKLPIQACSAQVAGFRNITCSSAAYDLLLDRVLGQRVIAKVLYRDPVTVQLFETVMDDGDGDRDDGDRPNKQLIDINQLMIDAVLEKESELPLPPVNSMGKCFVSYIYPNGDIYINVNSTCFHLVSNLIDLLIAREQELIVPSPSALFEKLDRVFLALFANDGLYYRCTVKANQTSTGSVPVHFIDYGNVEIVNLDDMREIPPTETALLTLPAQAILVRLSGVPDPAKPDLEFSVQAKDYLRCRVPDDKQISIQVNTPATLRGGIPLVELLEETEGHECISINATMKLKEDLFTKKSGRSTPVGSGGDRRSSSGSLRSSTPPSVVSIQPAAPLDMGEFVDVYVVFSANPGRFYAQRLADRTKFEAMMSVMHETYSRRTSMGLKPVAGSYMVALHDGAYHRVKIRSPEVMPKFACVEFVDVANEGVIAYDSLFPLEEQFAQLPCQGLECSLAGVEGCDWTSRDAVTFKEIVDQREFSAKLEKVEGRVCVLYLVDVTDPTDDLFIHEEMAKLKNLNSGPI